MKVTLDLSVGEARELRVLARHAEISDLSTPKEQKDCASMLVKVIEATEAVRQ